MTRYILLFLVFIGINTSLFSQLQISDFDYQIPASIFDKKGIVDIQGSPYLIESSDNSVRVSLVQDSIQLLYELNDYPIANPVNSSHGRLNSRSGFEVDSIFLFEIFLHKIRKRNLLTGEVAEEYQFDVEDLFNISGMEVVDEIIHFEKSNQNNFATYNISTNEYKDLPYLKQNTIRSQHQYISYLDFFNSLISYNAEDETVTTLIDGEISAYFGNNNWIAGQKGMIFSTSNSTFHFINADTTFVLDCAFEIENKETIFYETVNHYITLTHDDEASTIHLYNKSDCSLDQSFSHPKFPDEAYIKAFDIPFIQDKYALFALNYGTFATAKLMLLDKSDSSISLIDENFIQYINPNNFYQSGDEIYFMGHDASEPFPPNYVYSLNLVTKAFKADQTLGCFGSPISFGPSTMDSTFLVSGSRISQHCVHKFKDGEDSDLLYVSDDTRNGGLLSPRYLGVAEDKLVFKFEDGIYAADNSSNDDDKISLLTNAEEISDLAILGATMQGLVNMDGLSYHMRYHMVSNLFTLVALDEYYPQDANSIPVSNFIFGTFSKEEKKYFDLNEKIFETIPIQDEIVSFHKSNNNLLILSNCISGYCLTFFKDGTFTNLEPAFQNEPKIFSKKDGQFFIVEQKNSNESNVSLIKNDGSAGAQISINGALSTGNQDDIEEGPLSAFMFYNFDTKNLEVLMHRYDEFHQYSIPFINANSAPIFWYKVGKSIILKSDDDEEPGIYLCTLGKDLKKLEYASEGFENSKLHFSGYSDGNITFIVRTPQNETNIYQYDLMLETLTQYDSYNDFYSYPYLLDNGYRITPNVYFVTFNEDVGPDMIENSELFYFNISNPSLSAYYDFNQTNQSSDPSRFIASQSYLYFIARTYPDNSYQLYSWDKEEITSTNDDVKGDNKLKVYPNPASTHICLDNATGDIKILDSKGNIILNLPEYSRKDRIDISNLNQGIYFIEGIVNNNKLISSFIKI